MVKSKEPSGSDTPKLPCYVTGTHLRTSWRGSSIDEEPAVPVKLWDRIVLATKAQPGTQETE